MLFIRGRYYVRYKAMGETMFVVQVALPVFAGFSKMKWSSSWHVPICYILQVLETSIVDPDLDPDPHSFGCSASGSVLGMRIRIQDHGHWPKLNINLIFCLSKRLLYLRKYTFFDLLPTLSVFFLVKINFLSLIRIRNSLAPWIRIRIEIKKKAGAGLIPMRIHNTAWNDLFPCTENPQRNSSLLIWLVDRFTLLFQFCHSSFFLTVGANWIRPCKQEIGTRASCKRRGVA